MEKEVATIWRQILRRDRVGRLDDFFELGGDSILLLELQLSLQARFNKDIQLRELMEHACVASLVDYLSQSELIGASQPSDAGLVNPT